MIAYKDETRRKVESRATDMLGPLGFCSIVLVSPGVTREASWGWRQQTQDAGSRTGQSPEGAPNGEARAGGWSDFGRESAALIDSNLEKPIVVRPSAVLCGSHLICSALRGVQLSMEVEVRNVITRSRTV